jgi:hypothetical protein
MLTLKQSEIKKMHAVDLEKVKGFKKGLSCIGKLYKITSRSSLLFKYC